MSEPDRDSSTTELFDRWRSAEQATLRAELAASLAERAAAAAEAHAAAAHAALAAAMTSLHELERDRS